MKYFLAISIALLPSAVLAEQFTPEQMLDVMTKSPSNRDVRVQDNGEEEESYCGLALAGGAVRWDELTAELPFGVCRNGRAFLQVSRLLVADAPGRNHAVFEVAVLQRHRFRVLSVIGRIEPATPLTTV